MDPRPVLSQTVSMSVTVLTHTGTHVYKHAHAHAHTCTCAHVPQALSRSPLFLQPASLLGPCFSLVPEASVRSLRRSPHQHQRPGGGAAEMYDHACWSRARALSKGTHVLTPPASVTACLDPPETPGPLSTTPSLQLLPERADGPRSIGPGTWLAQSVSGRPRSARVLLTPEPRPLLTEPSRRDERGRRKHPGHHTPAPPIRKYPLRSSSPCFVHS